MAGQLLIDFKDQHYPSLSFLLGNSNRELLLALEEDNNSMLYIWGDSTSLKNYLLHAWLAKKRQKGAMTIALTPRILHHTPLEKLLEAKYLTIENVDQWSEEEYGKLFALLSEPLNKDQYFLVSASVAPFRLDAPKEMRSRLSLGLSYALKPLSSEDKKKLMNAFLHARQTVMSEEVLQYLSMHGPRDAQFLLHTLEALEDYALILQRRITVPLVKQFFEEHEQNQRTCFI